MPACSSMFELIARRPTIDCGLNPAVHFAQQRSTEAQETPPVFRLCTVVLQSTSLVGNVAHCWKSALFKVRYMVQRVVHNKQTAIGSTVVSRTCYKYNRSIIVS